MTSLNRKSTRDVLISGGAGFMGAHLVSHLLATTDARITLLDDLADPGALRNVEWLKSQAGDGRLTIARSGLRHALRVADAAANADEIYILAGDLSAGDDTGIEGPLVVLEAARRSRRDPVVVCASAGEAPAKAAGSGEGMLRPARIGPFPGTESLVQDFSQKHQLPAVTLIMDTVTGPRQFAEPRDWVTRAEYAILSGCECCLPGHLSEKRDVLHVADAVHAILAARAYIGKTAGKAYDVSGGRARRVTVEEMVHLIERVCHQTAHLDMPPNRYQDEAPHGAEDSAFLTDTAWRPRRSLEETVREIAAFWSANRDAIAATARVPQIAVHSPRVRAA